MKSKSYFSLDVPIVTFINSRASARSINKFNILLNKKSFYVSFSGNSIIDQKELKKYGINKINYYDYRPYNRDEFLQEYISLIDQVSICNDSKIWWSSEVASKNRFTSELSIHLDKLMSLNNLIKKVDYDVLFIINLDLTIMHTVIEYCKKNGINTLQPSDPFFIKKIFIPVTISCRNFLLLMRKFLGLAKRIIFVKKLFRESAKDLPSYNKTIVVKTFLQNNSFNSMRIYKDIFFGDLLQQIQDENKNLLVLAHCITADYKRIYSRISDSMSIKIIPVEYFLTFKDLIKSMLSILNKRINIPKTIFFGENVSKIFFKEYLRTSIDLTNYMYFPLITNFIRNVNIERFILTYENRAWENMCIMAIKKISPKTKIIGYQHTVVPKAATEVFIGKNEKIIKPLPDKVLTVGNISAQIIDNYGNYPKKMIEPACALRYKYLFNVERKTFLHKNGKILLALEGVPQVYKLVDYCLGQLIQNDKYQINVRTHPILPWEKIDTRFRDKIDYFNNVNLSMNTNLYDDLLDSDICIYWGSTVALEALSISMPIVHFDMQTVLNYDPLFLCNDLKWTITKEDSLLKTIDSIYSLSPEEFNRMSNNAEKFMNDYFHPITKRNMNKFIYY